MQECRTIVAAYCRVSTEKDDQLASLDNQKRFFEEYVQRNNYELYQVYADEGISGTKLKNRRAFNEMMSDARKHKFDIVFVKDISRFSRNAVDFLQSIRELKSLGIQCRFVNANLSTEDGEFTLGILALVAQEESGNLSKRVKFGKAKNAKNGKVPNNVYGYDKTKGELFTLKINQSEAQTVRRIFNFYTQSEYGANKIATILNEEGLRTKRNCMWSQNAISRILSNPIYIGQVVNGREEIQDFLTGKRVKKSKENWIVNKNEDLSIISEEQFIKAQEMLNKRLTEFNINKERKSDKYALSTLIKCDCCGYSFRRISRQFKTKKYIKWACSGSNSNGRGFCENTMRIDEDELLEQIRRYIINEIDDKDKFVKNIEAAIKRKYIAENDARDKINTRKELDKLYKNKQKQIAMYEADVISITELKIRIESVQSEIDRLQKLSEQYEANGFLVTLDELMERCSKGLDCVLSLDVIKKIKLKKIIREIRVFSDGRIQVYM